MEETGACKSVSFRPRGYDELLQGNNGNGHDRANALQDKHTSATHLCVISMISMIGL